MADCFVIRKGANKNNKKPSALEFNKFGIVGYFDISSLDLDNKVWINQIDNTNNLTLPSGGILSNNALRLEGYQRGEFKYNIEPYTFYCIFKVIHDVSNWTPIITKGMTGNYHTHDFLICLDPNGYIVASAYASDVLSSYKGTDYHVVCITKKSNKIMLYVDGYYIGSADAYDGYYNGYYNVNYLYRGGSWDYPTRVEYLFCAFGTEYHNDIIVKNNFEFLKTNIMKK